jgi:hypothetical protein
MALSISGKKKGLTKEDLMQKYAEGHLFLPRAKIEKETKRLLAYVPAWNEMIDKSFLETPLKKAYKALLAERAARLD